jgi:hypothetical protein
MNVKVFFLALVSVALGVACGYLYFSMRDLMVLAVLTLAIAMAQGAAAPRWPWLWAVLLSVSIPAAAFLVRWRGWPAAPVRIESAAAAGAASAILGAYSGAFMRRMIARVRSQL